MAKKYQVIGSFTPETLDADSVIFDKDLTTTTAIGNIELVNGQATIPAKGKTISQVWESIFVKESNPKITQPSVSMSLNLAGSYEVGTRLTPSYHVTFTPGSYSFGPSTGVTLTSLKVVDTSGRVATLDSGDYPSFQVSDDSAYKLTATASYSDGVIPLTNVGNEYPEGQIKAGSISIDTAPITGYRKSFYGTLTSKDDLTSAVIRSLSGSTGRALSNGSTLTVNIPVGAVRVIIAYPATLRDLTSVKDVNGLNAEIVSSFVLQQIAVEGAGNYSAIDYKVFVLDFANSNDTANKFTVQI